MPTVRDVLEALRHENNSRLLWIDSLCIDQQNDNEKSWQLGLMRDIFAGAQAVIGWLGTGPSARRALHFLSQLPEAAATESHRLESHPFPWSAAAHPNDANWCAVNDLLRNEWFHRVWMVQEVACARSLVLRQGDEEVGWDGLVAVVKRVLQQDPYMQRCLFLGTTRAMEHGFDATVARGFKNIYTMDTIRQLFKETGRIDFGLLLKSVTDFDATQTKDKVYSLYGLCGSRERADYNQTDSFVILKALRSAILEGDMSLLDLGGCGNGRSPAARQLELPSWCPDIFPSLWSARGLPSDQYHAATHLERHIDVTLDKDGTIIAIRGTLLDTVVELGRVWNLDLESSRKLSEILKFVLKIGLRLAESYTMSKRASLSREGGPEKDVLWRTLTGDVGRVLANHEGLVSFEIWYQTFQRFLNPRTSGRGRGIDGVTADDEDMTRFIFALGAAMMGRRLCRTSGGSLGVVPSGAREGDIVAVLWGSRNLAILRPVPARFGGDSEDTGFEFVGSCYLQGAMLGELRNVSLAPTMLLLR